MREEPDRSNHERFLHQSRGEEEEIPADHRFETSLCSGCELAYWSETNRGGVGIGYYVCPYFRGMAVCGRRDESEEQKDHRTVHGEYALWGASLRCAEGGRGQAASS